MTTHKTGTREQWLAARLELLDAEKELTRQGDELAQRRQELPWVRIDKEYRFETDDGKASLADLFRGRSQLLVYHFMFGPDYAAGCPHCSAIADGFNGVAVHLAGHDVMLWAIACAAREAAGVQAAAGVEFPWASSFESDFNYDFNVAFTEEQQRRETPSTTTEKAASRHARPTDAPKMESEIAADRRHRLANIHARAPGMSAFVLEDGVVYHTYSAYAADWTGSGACTSGSTARPKGRNETGVWWHHHDSYEPAAA